jgi:hypothetical protein
MKKALPFGALLLIFLCSACGANTVDSSGGTALDLPNYWHIIVSLTSSNAPDPSSFPVDPGKRYIALQVTATNVQSSDPTGNGSEIYPEDFSIFLVGNNTLTRMSIGGSFPGNAITPGNTATTTMYAEVPTQAGNYELDFQLHSIVTGTHAQCYIQVPAN